MKSDSSPFSEQILILLPLIVTKWKSLKTFYLKVKHINGATLLAFKLFEAFMEITLTFVVKFLNKFQSQFRFIDNLAGNILSTLVPFVPIIKFNVSSLVSSVITLTWQFLSKPCDTLNDIYLKNQTIWHNILNKLLDQAEDEKMTNSDHQECLTILDKFKLLTLIAFNSCLLFIHEKSLVMLHYFYGTKLYMLIEKQVLKKIVVSAKLQDKIHNRFFLTKDKIDLYKEYLDVLTKQFTVQDGRSLDNVHSCEERTKIIIRRIIGNLLILFQVFYTIIHNLSERYLCKTNNPAMLHETSSEILSPTESSDISSNNSDGLLLSCVETTTDKLRKI